MKTTARLNLESPHLEHHRASIAVVAAKAVPRGLPKLMAWFIAEWANEVPDKLHKGDVWRDYIGLTEDRKGVGGSLLGTPAYADAFRGYIEGSPFATDPDGRYAKPIHAAMARLCGRQGHEGPTRKLLPAPFMARFLFRLAVTGSLSQAGDSMGIPSQVHHVYAEQALYRLWRTYEVAPGAMERVA